MNTTRGNTAERFIRDNADVPEARPAWAAQDREPMFRSAVATRRQRTAPTLPFGWGAVTVLAVGAVLTIIGIVIILFGMLQFFSGTIGNATSGDFSIGGFFSGFFGAVILLVIGAMFAGFGGWMIRLWWLFLIVGAVAGGGGANTVRGREEMAAGDIRVRCRSCGRLNPEDARFCLSCGQAV